MLNKKNYRVLSALICISLCASSTSINSTVHATNIGTAEVVSQSESSEETASDNSSSEETASQSESSEESASEPNSLEESASEPNSSEESASESDSSEENSTEDYTSEDAVTEESASLETETDTSFSEPQTEDFSDEELTTEELATEVFTEEDTLTIDDAQRSLYVEEALSTFYELLNEKPLMALLYHTDSYEIQRTAGSYDDTVATLNSGHTLYINDAAILDDQIWYQVSFWINGQEQSGYAEAYYLAYADEDWIAWEKEYLANLYPESTTYGITAFTNATGKTDTSDINAFPAIYQDSLRALKEQHPTWTFVPMNTGLDFNTAVSNEMGVKSLIQNTKSNAANGWVGDPCPTESGWYYATKPAVSHYMNPCNFLTETTIFQFEQLTFNDSYHNVSSIQTFLNNTFMKGKIPNDSAGRTYAQAFYEIGKNRKLSPIHLASRVYQEQGAGTSSLISGTYPGYEGYYNYFNVGVNGSSTEEKIKKGLTYAKEKGWNTRFKSLEGGSATIGNNYILKGQDTIYLQKFNVDANSPYGLYNHQYMQNIQAPASESSSTKKMYTNAGSLDSGFVFKIPVFQNMPGEKAIQSITLDKTELVLYRPDTILGDTTGLSSTATLSVSISPSDTTDDKTIAWTSSNPNLVSVKPSKDTQYATITALGAGEVTITAKTQNNKTAQCKVKVEAPIYNLVLTNLNTESDNSTSSSTMYTGQSLTLTADYTPKDTTSDTSIFWSSSNPSVASVSNGKVTALSEGTSIISATIAGITASYEIIVESCTVTFMSSDYAEVLKEVRAVYGESLDEGSFPDISELIDDGASEKLFIGWYTDKSGLGTRFDTDTRVYDKKIVLYPYFEEQGRGFYVIPVGDQTYTGSAIKPEVQVYDSVSYSDGSTELITLTKGQDYTVTYKNNKNVNVSDTKKPTIIVKGKGNYSGTAYVYFNITPKSLEENDITADHITVSYNGKLQKSTPSVYYNGKKLTAKTDFTITYPYTDAGAYKNAGVYPIVIKGKGNYSGTLTIYETISSKILLNKVSISKIPNQTYKNELIDKANNIGIIPDQLNVTYKNKALVESTDGGKTGDYTISYSNNLAIGTATATITAVEGSAYAGSKSITYKIVGTKINKAKAEGITAKEYTGNEADVWQPNATLTLNNVVLKESTDNGVTGDYIVSYANTSKTGTATIIFTGINEYSGQLKKTYKITGYNLSNGQNGPNDAITMAYYTQDNPSTLKSIKNLSEITSPYMKSSTKPGIVLYYNGTELIQGKDYTVKYANNTAITTSETAANKLPKLTITGKGNFKGTFFGTWTITDGAMSDTNGKLTMTAKDITYKNKSNNYKTTLTLTDANGAKLKSGKDYDKNVIYTYVNDTQVSTADGTLITRHANDLVDKNDIINAGTTIRATVKGIGAYAGNGNASISATYRIVTADISKAKLKVNAKEYLNGRPVFLDPEDIKLTMNNKELVYGVDYVIDDATYTNNTKKGKATVILRGKGTNYGGQKKVTFTIGSKILVWWKNL